MGTAKRRRCPRSRCSGLIRIDAISWAWMLEGLAALKKFGLASFCSPAKQKVKPRNARSGSSAQPERA